MDDEKCFRETVTALTTLGFSDIDKMDIFHILASILNLGNIKIVDNTRGSHGDGDSSFIKVSVKLRTIFFFHLTPTFLNATFFS